MTKRGRRCKRQTIHRIDKTTPTNVKTSKRPRRKRQRNKLAISSGRRLLSKVGEDYTNLWDEFIHMVNNDHEREGACSNGYDVLKEVGVYKSGKFQFSCSRSPELCDCISSVGDSSIGEQHFTAGALNLILYSHEGHAAYEIQENEEALTYGYVNDGRADRRRRLMRDGGGGGS